MIEFTFVGKFQLDDQDKIVDWVHFVLDEEGKDLGEINYIFCDDDYLLRLNVEFLEHDTLTDIISFDYTMGKLINGDIFISVERVRENAKIFNQSIDNELNRVMIHGILHYLGFKDKTEKDKEIMRGEEDKCLALFNAQ